MNRSFDHIIRKHTHIHIYIIYIYISESSPTSSVWASVGFDWVDHPESPVRHVVIGGQRVQMAGGHGQPEPIGDGMPHLAHEDWGDLSTKISKEK